MQEHDSPFSEAAQRLSHTGYALASLAEQHTRRTAIRTHTEAAQLERSGAQVRAPELDDAPDERPDAHRWADSSGGVSPKAPTGSAALPDSADRAAAEIAMSRAGDDRVAAAQDASAPDDPSTAAVSEHAEGLAHAATDTAAAAREAALAADKTASALAQETYPHALDSISAHRGRATAQPASQRNLQPSAARRASADSRPVPRR